MEPELPPKKAALTPRLLDLEYGTISVEHGTASREVAVVC